MKVCVSVAKLARNVLSRLDIGPSVRWCCCNIVPRRHHVIARERPFNGRCEQQRADRPLLRGCAMQWGETNGLQPAIIGHYPA